jgi:hypothetical protein
MYVEINPPPGTSFVSDYRVAYSLPFWDSESTQLGPSHVEAQISLTSDADNADFYVQTQQHLQGYGPASVNTFGSIAVMPSVDSILTIHEEYLFNQPASQDGSAGITLGVKYAGTTNYLLLTGVHGGTIGFGSPSGLLTLDRQLRLTANIPYKLQYSMNSDSFDPPPPNAVWEQSGFVQFSIRPIPEPAAFLPLVVLLARSRRRKS